MCCQIERLKNSKILKFLEIDLGNNLIGHYNFICDQLFYTLA